MSELKPRTKAFAIQICRLAKALKLDSFDRDIMRQLVRSATSVGANYRAACRARSTADMIAKLKIVEEECDESLYWLELLVDLDVVGQPLADPLTNEATQLLRMTVRSITTLRKKIE